MKVNNMNVNVTQSFYNKTEVKEDGVTHIVDTEHSYTLYQLDINKVYFNGNRQEVAEQIIEDLQAVIDKIKEMKEHDKRMGIEDNGR